MFIRTGSTRGSTHLARPFGLEDCVIWSQMISALPTASIEYFASRHRERAYSLRSTENFLSKEIIGIKHAIIGNSDGGKVVNF
jgi:hypothetical protein